MSDSVLTERRGPVTIVTLNRPEKRNAVDRATAARLADAFRAFDTDDEAAVAILRGEGPSFSAGADLQAVSTGEGNRVEPDGDGTDGADAAAARQAGGRGGPPSSSPAAPSPPVAGATRFASGAGRHGSFG